ADDNSPLSIIDLRKYLKQRLPEYMVPSAFVLLDSIPLTRHGKVDKQALPSPDVTRPDSEETFVAPRTPAEELMANIWMQVLKLDRVGVHDNFFDLGGDSIINIQVAARANRAGLKITPRQIFQYQTIAELVAAVSTEQAISAEQGLVIGPVPLTPIQRWFFERETIDAHQYNQAVMLEFSEAAKPEPMERAIRLLWAHHDALRMRFSRGESGPRQVM